MSNPNDIHTQRTQYQKYLENERGRGEKTVENYTRYIDRFLTFSKCKTTNGITKRSIDKFFYSLEKSGYGNVPLSINTLNYHRIALRSFLSYLRKNNASVPSPKDVPLNQTLLSTPDVLTEDECEVLVQAGSFGTNSELRDTALVYTLLFTGVRVSEICALTQEDLIGKSISIKNRTVSVPPILAEVLKQYLNTRKDADTALFVNNGKRTDANGSIALTPRSVQRIVTAYAKKAGIEKTVTPKTLRHTRAGQVAGDEDSLGHIQEMLGYTHKTSTQAYLRRCDTTKQ